MVPRSSILRGFETVCEVLAWSNWTLSNSIYSVHVHGLVLADSMPVDACTILEHVIDHGYVQCLRRNQPNRRSRPIFALTSPQHASNHGPGYVLLNSFALSKS